VLLDHAGNVERHGLPHEDREWSLEAGTAERKGDIKCRICPKCYAYGTKSPCEYCGYALPVQTREVRTAEGRLVEVSPPQPFSSPEERLFAQESDRALVMGFKPGYASAKYKEKYDKWPPWAWSQKLLAQYAADPDWQERVRQRTVQREKWQKTAPAESLRDTVPAGDLRDTQPSTFEFEDL